jgi:hypothetical protein
LRSVRWYSPGEKKNLTRWKVVVNFTLEEIPNGEAGTDATLKRIIEVSQRSLYTPELRLLALQVLKAGNVSGRDKIGASGALYGFVKNRIRFVNDPIGVETVQEPAVTLRLGAGDCDDQSVLMAALARSIGIPARFAVIGADPDHFRHIYPELHIGGKWLTADTTSPRPFGKAPPPLGVKKIYNFKDSRGLSMPNVQTLSVRRDVAGGAVRNEVWRQLSYAWENGLIDMADLRNYISAIDQGMVEFSGNTFFEPVIRQTAQDFIDYIQSNDIPSRKAFSEGLGELSGIFGSIWSAVKKVVKPAAVIGATVVGGPAAGVAVAGAVYSPTTPQAPAAAPPGVTIPAGAGTVTYLPPAPAAPPVYVPAAAPVSAAPPVYPAPAAASVLGLLSNPVVLIGGAALVFLLLSRR